MKKEHREELIALLILHTGWAKEAFDRRSDKEITELYDRYVKQ